MIKLKIFLELMISMAQKMISNGTCFTPISTISSNSVKIARRLGNLTQLTLLFLMILESTSSDLEGQQLLFSQL